MIPYNTPIKITTLGISYKLFVVKICSIGYKDIAKNKDYVSMNVFQIRYQLTRLQIPTFLAFDKHNLFLKQVVQVHIQQHLFYSKSEHTCLFTFHLQDSSNTTFYSFNFTIQYSTQKHFFKVLHYDFILRYFVALEIQHRISNLF